MARSRRLRSSAVIGERDAVAGELAEADHRVAAPPRSAASAQAGTGNTLITLPDGATMTLTGIARIDSTFSA
jgi:hypothetical protein